MGRFHWYFVAFFLLASEGHGNDNPAYPSFARQAQFFVENIVTIGQYERVLTEIRYDYDANRLVTVSGQTFTYHNYSTLRKSVYTVNELKRCDVYPIDVDNPLDGLSAVSEANDNATHIRPLGDFLGFPPNATYLGETLLRGYIHVQQWIVPMSDEANMIWSFAKPEYTMPWNTVNDSIPVQSALKRKSDGVVLQAMNIFSYQSMVTSASFFLPEGIFCENLLPADDLLSVQDMGMVFPEKFSVRVDASSTSQLLWHSVHLRHYVSSGGKWIRYDYTPTDSTQSPVTIILDYTPGATRSYRIDRRTGSCVINDSVDITSTTSILHNPIEALIKYETLLLTSPPHRIFQLAGQRPCRGSMRCTNVVGQLPYFPPDSQDDWLKTSLEWGWSKHDIDDDNAPYDYPVYLNLNLYHKTVAPPANVHYEFYDYRTDVHPNEFDVNLCYRSNQLWYSHLAFQLKITNELVTVALENPFFNHRRLTEQIRDLIRRVTTVKLARITQLELDYHRTAPGHNDTLYCIFTLLDRTPFVDPTSEIEVLDARQRLEEVINSGTLQLTTEHDLVITAIPGSLEDVRYFYVFNPNASGNQTDHLANITVHVNRTIVEYVDEVHEKIQYSDGAQAGAVLGGMIVGIVVGLAVVLLVTHMIKQKANASPTGGLTFRNISFRIRNNRAQDDQAVIAMEQPIDGREDSSS